MTPTVRIDPRDEDETRLWKLTHETADLLVGVPWVLIGGQMVAILELEHGRQRGRTTVDVDALVDVRTMTSATRTATSRLRRAGFEPQPTTDGLSYRFARASDVVDLLAPDNLGPHADLVTLPPGVTLETIGGTQALRRRRDVSIEVLGDVFSLPVPTLVGALVIKARAAASSTNRKHRRDLARLLVLVTDVDQTRSELTEKERGYLRAHDAMLDASDEAWRGVAGTEDGVIALDRLSARGKRGER